MQLSILFKKTYRKITAPITAARLAIARTLSDCYETALNQYPQNSFANEAKKGWSIIIITNGKNQSFLDTIIHSIDTELSGSPYEIIIVGPKTVNIKAYSALPAQHLLYKELGIAPGWITRKKNLGAKATHYDKLVFTHDYIAFESGWKKGFDQFGDDFQVCVNRILRTDGERYRDWVTWDYPGIGSGHLPYNIEQTHYQYISGSYFIAKRDFFLKNQLDEKLHWEEGEDGEWSFRIRQKITFKFNPNSTVRLLKDKPPMNPLFVENTKKLEEIFKNKA